MKHLCRECDSPLVTVRLDGPVASVACRVCGAAYTVSNPYQAAPEPEKSRRAWFRYPTTAQKRRRAT
jgi:hypothetical protein